MLTLEDKLAIHDLISLYGHVIDERQWERVSELFTAEARYDVSDFGAGVHGGADAIGRLWQDTPDAVHPLAHHATNVLVTEDSDGTVRVVSKGIGVRHDGRTGSVVYRDVVVRSSAGWRIAERVALKRRVA